MAEADELSSALDDLALDDDDSRREQPWLQLKPSQDPACDKPWSALAAAERKCAEILLFQRETWGDDPCGKEEHGYEEDWSSVPWTWTQLAGDRLAAAEALGFSQSSWRGGVAGTPSSRRHRRRGKKNRGDKLPLAGANAVASPLVGFDGKVAARSPQPSYLWRKKEWSDLPDWIMLSEERGTAGRPFPPLHDDPLFADDGGALLLPFLPPGGAAPNRGAAVVCPGGNYEFLAPREGAPIARWLAESLGIPAYVLRYRLLPAHGLDAMHEDFALAIRAARASAHGGPVFAIGFSAGGHLVASGGAAAAVAAREPGAAAELAASVPDAQALLYPCTKPDGWLEDETCGFYKAECQSPQVQSLAKGKERLAGGAAFVRPPPTFIVASTVDDVCPVGDEADPYVAAAKEAGAHVQYLRGNYGDHGFGLKRFWADPCIAWLQSHGFGRPIGAEGEAAAGEGEAAMGQAAAATWEDGHAAGTTAAEDGGRSVAEDGAVTPRKATTAAGGGMDGGGGEAAASGSETKKSGKSSKRGGRGRRGKGANNKASETAGAGATAGTSLEEDGEGLGATGAPETPPPLQPSASEELA